MSPSPLDRAHRALVAEQRRAEAKHARLLTTRRQLVDAIAARKADITRRAVRPSGDQPFAAQLLRAEQAYGARRRREAAELEENLQEFDRTMLEPSERHRQQAVRKARAVERLLERRADDARAREQRAEREVLDEIGGLRWWSRRR